MLKKMKRVVSMDLSPSPSPSYVVDEDARSRMRHQHLMQEYEELVKDVQAMKNNLQRAKERKLTLLAEVKFLRGRYKYLMKNQIPNPQQERNPVWIQNPEIRSEILSKERTYKQKEVAMKNPAPVLDLNQISRGEDEGEFQVAWEPMKVEKKAKKVDEQPNDLKLSVCRDMGNGSNRSGKRKISWQDQVALRV